MSIQFTDVLAIVETAMLIVALYFMTGMIREKKRTPARKANQMKAFVFLGVYLILNVIRNNFL